MCSSSGEFSILSMLLMALWLFFFFLHLDPPASRAVIIIECDTMIIMNPVAASKGGGGSSNGSFSSISLGLGSEMFRGWALRQMIDLLKRRKRDKAASIWNFPTSKWLVGKQHRRFFQYTSICIQSYDSSRLRLVRYPLVLCSSGGARLFQRGG